MGSFSFDDLFVMYEAAKRSYYKAVRLRDETFEDLRDVENTKMRQNLLSIMEQSAENRRQGVEKLKNELRQSSNVYDKVYYYTFVEKQKPKYTAAMIGYTERHISRIIKEIKEKIRESLDE